MFISEPLDAAAEDEQYADMMKTIARKIPSLIAGEKGIIMPKSVPVTPEDERALLATTKDIYVFVASKYHDKLGSGSSEYCSRYVNPNWNVDVGCNRHNR